MSLAVLLILIGMANSPAYANDTKPAEKKRTFLFVAHANASAWKFLVENPQDRQAVTSEQIKKLGGEMLGYYFGLGNGRNYVIVSLSDSVTVQAITVLRLASGLLHEYEVIELIKSADMLDVYKRIDDLRAVDDIQKK